MNRATSGNVFSDDTQVADASAVQARKRLSALLSSLGAVLQAAGVIDACHALKGRISDPQDKTGKRKLEFDFNEITRVYQTVMEAAQIAEIEAEERAGLVGDPVYPLERKFRLPAFRMELLFRREMMPKFIDDDDGQQKQKFINAYARCWHRRWRKVHIIQSYLHLGLVDKEKGISSSNKKVPPQYTDRLTDLTIEVGKRTVGANAIRNKRFLITHYRRAAVPVIEAFQLIKANEYAPGWVLPDAPVATATAAPDDVADDEATIREKGKRSLRSAVRTFAKDSLQKLSSLNLSEDEEITFRLELQALFDAEIVGSPLPPGGGDRDASSPVIVNSDNDGENSILSPSPAPDISNSLRKSEETANPDGTPVYYLNLAPDEQAGLAADALASVGCTETLAVWLTEKPLDGEAQTVGTDRPTPAQLRQRAARYIERSEKQKQSVAIRFGRGKTTFLEQPCTIQVDDAKLSTGELLRPLSFLEILTSPDNCQPQICLADELTNAELKDVRDRFFEKLHEVDAGANAGARGSVRWPGSLNVKEKYRPVYPRVGLLYVAMGRRVTVKELDEGGWLAAPKPVSNVVKMSSRPRFSTSKLPTDWPDYRHYVSTCASKDDGSPDLNRADEKWCIRALSMGWPRSTVASQFRSLRDKAARRPDYVERTLDAAESWLTTHSDNGRERIYA